MVMLRLTPGNLKSVKRALRSRLPNIKLAQLTEAIAAALGFRTHAALLAAVKCDGPGSELIANFDAKRMAERLSQLSQIASVDVVNAAVTQIIDLPDACWQQTLMNDKKKQKDWFNECRRLSLPYVIVMIRGKYATLEWDCITVDQNCDEGVRGDRSEELVRELFSIFQQTCVVETGRPMFGGSAFVGSIERLLPETACVLADEFFARLYCATRTKRVEASA